jgi:hypothetical protein
MPNPGAIKKYLLALEAFHKGDRDRAATLLANSFGANASNSIIETSLDKLIDTNSRANEIALIILSGEVSKHGK